MDAETFLVVKNTFVLVFFSLVFVRLIVQVACKHLMHYDLMLSILYTLKLLVVLSYLGINYELFVWEQDIRGIKILLYLVTLAIIIGSFFYMIRHFRKWRQNV